MRMVRMRGSVKHLVALHVAEMLGFRHATDDRRMGPRGAPQEQRKAQAHAGDHAQLDPASRVTPMVAAIAAKSAFE
jgi:hypothetical protein